MISVKHMQHLCALAVVAATMGFGVAQATPVSMQRAISQQASVQQELEVDVTGIFNNDERGSVSNVIRDFYVGPRALITSLRWDVNVTTYPGSYLSEMQVTFSDSLGNGVTFTPGDGDDEDGTMDYAGFQDLGDLDKIFAVGNDGILRLEFHDAFKDLAFDEPEGVWNFGTLTFGIAEAQVPEPPTYALMLGGLLLLSGTAKRRRS